MKMLLIESMAFVVDPGAIKRAGGKYVVESRGGRMIITLPMTKLDEFNLNNRKYSTMIMEGAIRKAKKLFEDREMLSSVNEHPTEPYVTPGEASHVVTEAWIENGMLYGTWEILETHNGKNLRALVEAEVAFGVSIRGLGSVDNYGNILEDYELLGCDCVGEPSAQLRVRPQIKENLDNAAPGNNKSTVKESKMASKDATLKYLSEQKVLMDNDAKGENKLAVFQRAAAVESFIAESALAGKDFVEVHNKWEELKGASFALVTESSDKETKDAVMGESVDLLKKLLEKRTTQVKVMASGLTQLSEQLKATKVAAVKAVAEGRSKFDIDNRVVETAGKKSNAIVESLLKENQQMLALATENELKYRLAVKEAAKNAKAYRFAILEAAKLANENKKLKEGKVTSVPAAKPVVKETTAVAKPVAGVIDNTKPTGRKLNENRSGRGEVRMASSMDI